MDASPRVSVVLLTYNHERYLGQAIESVLMQRTAEPFEVVITEDRSTDGTGAIIEQYAADYPDRIGLIRSPVNLCTNAVTTRAIDLTQGEYLAFLDGDDYWSSSDKLQRQVDFLDAHPECSMCFHDVQIVDSDGREKHASFRRTVRTPEFGTYADLAIANFVPGPSPMIRRSAVASMPTWYEGAPYGDLPLYLEAAKHGRIGAIDSIMGVYREHSRGLWSSLDDGRRTNETLSFLRFLEKAEPGERTNLIAGAAQIRAELIMRQLRAGTPMAALGSLVSVTTRGPAHVEAVLSRTWNELGQSLARRRARRAAS